MFRHTVRISGLAALMLVVVRVAIGWHFFYEGVWKYENPSFSAEAFLRQARGPFADKFHALIPDYDGSQRLTLSHSQETWDEYRRNFINFYRLDAAQTAEAANIYDRKIKQVKQFLEGQKNESTEVDEVKAYLEFLKRRAEEKAEVLFVDPTIGDVPFQQKRNHDETTRLRAKVAPWLAEIDRLGSEFRKELSLLLNKEQRKLGLAPEPKSKLEYIDMLTTYGLLAIGFCLMAGLFTRLACLGGAIFLLQIVLCQPAWPTLYPPLPPSAGHSLIVTKEFLEMLMLLALATTHVGRWAGLDFFIHNLLIRPFTAKEKRYASKS